MKKILSVLGVLLFLTMVSFSDILVSAGSVLLISAILSRIGYLRNEIPKLRSYNLPMPKETLIGHVHWYFEKDDNVVTSCGCFNHK